MPKSANSKPTYGVICCGVLEWHFRRAAERTANRVEIVVLPAGLHADPKRLRSDLQAEIDRMSAERKPDGIILGYGLCGRGVAGIAAREAPLAIVRAEDCTAIFFGSERRYREEFLKYPGTLYFCHGWIHARGKGGFQTVRNRSLYGPDQADLVARFGEERAQFVSDFRASWKRNYERAAYITFRDDPDAETQQARVRALAETEGWAYEEISGDERLFDALVSGRWTHEGILVVRPGQNIVPAPGAAVMDAGRDIDASYRKALNRFVSKRRPRERRREGVGLGVDAGGTFTDSVVYSFDEREVLSKSKAPTTHENLLNGVEASLAGLDPELLCGVSRVALSTTLATNAIVEGRGRPVGLLLMGIDPADLDKFQFLHKRLVPGRLTIEGVERTPIDEAATRGAARSLQAEGVEAFAVSGYGGVIDSRHELEVARLAHEETGLPVVCGHELTRSLNLYRRGVTAALNARLIPLIQDLIRSVKRCLESHGLHDVPLMVVCGDGTQMLDRYAERLPVEQILSGPAASVIGALELSGRRDLVVADMGGTTLDVAVVEDGEPLLDMEGARVGRFQTCVHAMRIHTVGLGGDSEVRLADWPRTTVGPRRIVPLAVLADRHASALKHLHDLARANLSAAHGFEPTDFAMLHAADREDGFNALQREILSVLKGGPLPVSELAGRVGLASASLLPLERLERAGALIRAGLTPTDLLHLEGKYTRFCGRASALAFHLVADLLEVAIDDIRDAIRSALRKGITTEILRSVWSNDGWDPEERSGQFLLESLFSDAAGRPQVRLKLNKPVAPIGAPVRAFFPDLEGPLGTDILLSDHVEVANAVGAIAGEVALSEQVDIVAAADGALQLQSRVETRKFFGFEEALDYGENLIRRALEEKAALNDVPPAEPEFLVRESAPETRNGIVFLGVRLTGRIRA